MPLYSGRRGEPVLNEGSSCRLCNAAEVPAGLPFPVGVGAGDGPSLVDDAATDLEPVDRGSEIRIREDSGVDTPGEGRGERSVVALSAGPSGRRPPAPPRCGHRGRGNWGSVAPLAHPTCVRTAPGLIPKRVSIHQKQLVSEGAVRVLDGRGGAASGAYWRETSPVTVGRGFGATTGRACHFQSPRSAPVSPCLGRNSRLIAFHAPVRNRRRFTAIGTPVSASSAT